MDNDEVEEQGRESKRRGRERKWRGKRERREDKNILMDSLLSPMSRRCIESTVSGGEGLPIHSYINI